MKKSFTTNEILEKLEGMRIDAITKKRNGNFVIMRGFFYTNGYTHEKFANSLKSILSDAVIVDSYTIWKPFRGGASVKTQSHFGVEFNLPYVETK